MVSPSPTAPNGDRDHRGRFLPGNGAAKGNPHAAKVGKLRAALLNAIAAQDIRRVVKALVAEAERGNVQAAKELLDRAVGKPIEADLLERIQALENAIEQVNDR